MLNRTNRTLSATSTRLNLGTRSFAFTANGNIGNKTLRLHAHAASHAVRVGVASYPVPVALDMSPIMGPKPGAKGAAMAMLSGSSPMSAWPGSGSATWGQARLAVEPSEFARRADDRCVVSSRREDVVPQRPTARPVPVSQNLTPALVLSCRLAGRSARDAMVSDAAP